MIKRTQVQQGKHLFSENPVIFKIAISKKNPVFPVLLPLFRLILSQITKPVSFNSFIPHHIKRNKVILNETKYIKRNKIILNETIKQY